MIALHRKPDLLGQSLQDNLWSDTEHRKHRHLETDGKYGIQKLAIMYIFTVIVLVIFLLSIS